MKIDILEDLYTLLDVNIWNEHDSYTIFVAYPKGKVVLEDGLVQERRTLGPFLHENSYVRPQKHILPPFSNFCLARDFNRCSGCTHEFDLDKPPVLQEVADFFSGHGIEDFTFSRGRLSEWRCRAKLAVRGTPEKPLIGLYQEGTHTVQDIPDCRAHHPSINYAIKLLKQGISELSVQPFDEDAGTGELRYVQMTVTTYNTSIPVAQRYEQARVQVSFVWNSRDERSKNSEKLSLLQEIIFGHKWRHIGGEADLWERFGGVDICLDPYSFGQANTLSFNSLLHKLIKYVPRGSTVVDLYSGAGVIGLAIAASRKCSSVKLCQTLCKVWPENAKFEPGLARKKSANITVFWSKAKQSLRNQKTLIEIFQVRFLYLQEPIHWLEGSSVAIVDPPRKGLHPSVINALQRVALSERKAFKAKSSLTKVKDEKRPWILRAREPAVHVDSTIMEESSGIWPETLIYISCGWDSFKKDCKSLISNEAWHLENAHAFNFFPGTDRYGSQPLDWKLSHRSPGDLQTGLWNCSEENKSKNENKSEKEENQAIESLTRQKRFAHTKRLEVARAVVLIWRMLACLPPTQKVMGCREGFHTGQTKHQLKDLNLGQEQTLDEEPNICRAETRIKNCGKTSNRKSKNMYGTAAAEALDLGSTSSPAMSLMRLSTSGKKWSSESMMKKSVVARSAPANRLQREVIGSAHSRNPRRGATRRGVAGDGGGARVDDPLVLMLIQMGKEPPL
ncbi:hypothetical protein TRIUR3_27776 [Triticum urartu]|uniref:Uncharacterized protein n=1 Tax=Triticum urartu TaxID=4572 RepID=M8A6C5_TRIUA|nr:hypothetical protein TRIUR3_27776 [Triticum urartu]